MPHKLPEHNAVENRRRDGEEKYRDASLFFVSGLRTYRPIAAEAFG